MNPGNGQPLEDLIEIALDDYQRMLAGDGASQSTRQSSESVPMEAQERLRRAKHCLAAIHELSKERRTSADQEIEPRGTTLPKAIGRFTILSQLGVGGFGIVYLAVDPRTRRQVAIKVPRIEVLASTALLRRFEQEAQAAAMLDHPNIVAVYEAGGHGIVPYIASPYLPGRSLAKWLSEGRRFTPEQAAGIVRQLADGLAHAHERGVLHRDIKPSNVLMTEKSNHVGASDPESVTPKLTDFGLAKLIESNNDFTHSGAMVGTVSYMSPEQASGRIHDIDARSDVYALGAVLYETLTGRPPFVDSSDLAVLQKIASQEPTPIRRSHPLVPLNLEAICLKCLEKDRDRRYESARSLAEDLRRFLEGKPVMARPATAAEQVAKWARRHPAVAGLILSLVTSVVLITCGLAWFTVRISAALTESETSAERAREGERIAKTHSYASDMRLAQDAWDRSAPAEALALLERHIPRDGSPDLRGVEWRYLWHAMHEDSDVVARQPSPVWSIAMAPDFKEYATGDTEGAVRQWRLDPPELVRELRGHQGNIDALAYTPDGKLLISGADDKTIRFWNATDGSLLRVIEDHSDWLGAIAVSPDGRWLASGDGSGRVLLRDFSKPDEPRELYRHTGAVRWIAFNPAQPWLASAGEQDKVRVWNYRENRPPRECPEGSLSTPENATWRNAVIERDGSALFATERDRILIWTFRNPAEWAAKPTSWKSSNKVMSIALLGDAEYLVDGADAVPEIQVRSLRYRGKVKHVLKGHSDSVRCLVALKSDHEFLSGSGDGTVRKWNIGEKASSEVAESFPGQVTALAWSANNKVVIGGLDNGYVGSFGYDWFLHGALPTNLSATPTDETRICGLAIDAAENRLVVVKQMGKPYVITGGHQAQVVNYPDYILPQNTRKLALVEGGRVLSYLQGDWLVTINVDTGQELWRFEHPGVTNDIASMDDRTIVTAAGDGVVRCFEATSGEIVRQSERQPSALRCMDLSANCQKIAVGGTGSTIRVLDAATLERTASFSSPFRPNFIAFVDGDRRILIWDDHILAYVHAETGQTMLKMPRDFDLPAVVSPDGSAIAISRGNRTILRKF